VSVKIGLGKRFSETTFPISDLKLTDARQIHAVAHPVRLAILDHLRDRETATATDCSAVVGESVQSCAYHLRTLARLGLVEEVPGADGRERPWRLRATGLSVPKEIQGASPKLRAAWRALRGRVVERDIDLLRRFLENEETFTPEQHSASTVRNMTLFATPEELHALADEVSALLRRYAREKAADRPEGGERIHAVFWLIPRKEEDAR
jgi:DNA-binding transcriptional ArsR family regulator